MKHALAVGSMRYTLPASALVLLTSACASAPARPETPPAAPAQQPAAVLPTAQQVIDRYIAAIGGRDVVTRRKSSRATISLDMPAQGIRADMEVFTAAPDRLLVKTTIPGMGETLSGYNGTVGWSIDPVMGPRLLEGAQLQQTREDADFYGALHEPSKFTTMEVVEEADFEGKRVYKLRLVRKSGRETFEHYDVTTGLLVGTVGSQATAMGDMKVTTVMGDYKDFAGMMLPTSTTMRAGPTEMRLKVNTVEFDTVDPAVFELPPQIKALTSK
jgi:hypothetical protein